MKKQIYRSLFVLAVINSIAWIARVVASGELRQVQFLPDDGYYYLTLARNFITYHEWTFDSGLTLTTGFHLLYAYFLAFVYRINFLSNFVGFSVIMSYVFILVVFFVIYKVYRRNRDSVILLTAALFVSSMNFIYNSLSAVEWNLVLMISALYFFVYFREKDREYRRNFPLLMLLAFLGGLARMEFSLTVGCLFLATQLTDIIRKRFRMQTVLKGLLPVLGSILGVIFIFVHNYIISGDLIQSSARIKYFWSQTIGYNFTPFIYNCLRMFFPIPRLHIPPQQKDIIYGYLQIIVPIVLVVVLFLWRGKIKSLLGKISFTKVNYRVFEILTGCLFTLLAYIVFYGFNSQGIQSWYTGMVMVPLAVMVYFILVFFKGKAGAFVAGVVVILTILNISITWASAPLYKQQVINAVKGIFVAEHLPDKRVAAWDSGLIGYFSDGRVVNLDGLVNNEIAEYILGDSVAVYILKKDIEFLIQTPPTTKRTQKLMGLTDGILNECLIENPQTFRGHKILLYEVDREKLRGMVEAGE